MTAGYGCAAAYRQALEDRLRMAAEAGGRDLNWLRRRHAFLRMLHRLAADASDRWVLKGGLAVELRRPGMARATKDIDLAMRSGEFVGAGDAEAIAALLRAALDQDVDGDLFVFDVEPPTRMAEDAHGRPAWRFRVSAMLAGRRFSDARVDVIVRPEELAGLTTLTIDPGTAAPPGAPVRTIAVTDIRQQFAEKLHALSRSYSTGESSRVKDLLDVVLLIEDGLTADAELVRVVRRVFAVRATHPVPTELDDPPAAWREPYRNLATELGVEPADVLAAHRLVAGLWESALGEDT